MGTATRTVVFTDLANYTAKVARSDREGLRKILQEHEELVAPVVQKYGGRIVKNLGDSYMCLFESATDAVRASLDVQDLVSAGGQNAIRLAMTTGDVEEISGDAFGEAANMASRILSKTPSGEVWFGIGTRVCMNPAEIPWESVGHFQLKGMPGEHEVFRAVPKTKAYISDAIAAAAKLGNLVRIKRGTRPPLLPPDPVVMLEGFLPGSQPLEGAVDALPVLNPASLWLVTYNIAPSDRENWTAIGRGLVIGTPEAVEQAIQDALRQVQRSSGSDTIVLDVGHNADLDLVMSGLALPAVPLADVVQSYFYDLLPDGRWVNRSDRSILRVEVETEGARVQALAPGVSINGRGLAAGEATRLNDGDLISTPAGSHLFREPGNGYSGVLLADTEMRLGVATGQTVELGREPNHPGLAYPDRRGQENIRWCSGVRAAKARANGFTLDRALAGRRQAAIQMIDGSIQLSPLHERCATFVLRGANGQFERANGPIGVQVDDIVVAGTTAVGLRTPQ